MDNKQKKIVRRVLSAGGTMLFVFSLIVYAGIELPFFNHYNPLFNPYPWVIFGFGLFIARTFIKDKKGVGNFIDFFDRSGLVVGSYEIPFENIKPTHANYIDKEGEKKSIRHTHPFAIPSTDMWTNEFLVPSSGLEALNPTALVRKYGAQLRDETITVTGMTEGEEEVKDKDGKVKKNKIWVKTEGTLKVGKEIVIGILSNLSAWIPEIMALDPQVLHIQESESDNVDGMNQEAAFQTAEVRKGWFSGDKTKQVLAYIAVGALVGMLSATFFYMAGKVDFAHLNGVIQP